MAWIREVFPTLHRVHPHRHAPCDHSAPMGSNTLSRMIASPYREAFVIFILTKYLFISIVLNKDHPTCHKKLGV